MALGLRAWLDGLGLGQYAELLEANAIDGEVLRDLTDADLAALGIPLGHRKRLLKAIAALGAGGEAPARVAREAERRQLTVMFVDLVGSTALSRRLDPEEMQALLRRYQNSVAGEIARFEGHVAKLMGDGVLAYFGWPKAHEDEAERACRAGLAVVGSVAALRAPGGEALACRVGIATGLVVVGELLGEGAAREESVAGETPNLASRLQGIAGPGEVVIAEATRRLLGRLFELADLGPVELKGLDAPVRAFRVVAEAPAESRFEALHPGGPSRLVGREQELALLLERWRQARAGEGQVVVLVGEPGIGKSRIALALREATRDERRTSLRYFCSPHHAGSALWPVLAQLERAAGLVRDDPPATRLAKLQALLRQGVDEPGEATALLAELLGIPAGDRAPLELSAAERKARTFAALLAQLEGLAARGPVLMLLEDAHWLDPTTQELFDLIVERLARLPALLLVTSRPEFQPSWAGLAHVTTLRLNRLGREHVLALIDQTTGGRALPAEVTTQIVGKTDGVPLFVEELTKTVLESGILARTEGGFTLAGPLPGLAIPATLQDSLMARLDRLAPVKEAAQAAACIGREFASTLLAAALGRSEPDVVAALGQLVAAELVFRRGAPPAATYVFKHALVQDAAYASLLRSRRQQIHARIAEALAEPSSTETTAAPEIVAHHCSEAGLVEPAIDWWQRAARRAAEHGAYREAAAYLKRVLALLESLPPTPARDARLLKALIQLGPVQMVLLTPSSAEVRELYQCAEHLAAELGDDTAAYTTSWGLWFTSLYQRDLASEAAPPARRMLALAETSGSEVARLQAHHAMWTTTLHTPDLHACAENSARGMAIYDPVHHADQKFLYSGHDPGVCGLTTRATALWLLGELAPARSELERGLALARSIGHPPSLGVGLFHVCRLHQLAGTEEAALATAKEMAALAAARPMPRHFALLSEAVLGWSETLRGEAARGRARIKVAIDGLVELRMSFRLPYLLLLAAEAALRDGDLGAAAEALDRSFAVMARTGERLMEAEMHRLAGRLALHRGEAGAEAAFGRALEVARGQGARWLELRAALDLARLWAQRGERARAHDLLTPIHGWFTEGHDLPDLAQAKALLKSLA